MKIKDIYEFVQDNKRLVILPIAAFTLLSVIYALFKPSIWDASQALFVRDESIGAMTRGGRFESTDAMQTAQETIYEMCHHPEVLKMALQVAQPKKDRGTMATQREIDDFGRNVYVSAPNGAKFGRTEMIYLSVRDRKKDRAVDLTRAMADSLVFRMKKLRVERYDSIIRETEQGVKLAQQELDKATDKLASIEKQFGNDLAELRVLSANGSGQGNVRQSLGQIESELRNARGSHAKLASQYDQLSKSIDDPRGLINMPNELLDGQATLRRLKEGLVDAQLRASRLMGIQSQRHPDVQAAAKAVEQIRNQLRRELKVAVRGLEDQISRAKGKVTSLENQQKQVGGRMGGLAAVRTRYSNLSMEVSQRSQYLEESRRSLAVARSNKISAATVSLIQPIEQPIPGSRPLGPGRTLIVLGGVFAGCLTSLGLIFLLIPQDEPQGTQQSRRRASDELYPAFGRRANDSPKPADRNDRRRGGVERQGVTLKRRDADYWSVKDPLKN